MNDFLKRPNSQEEFTPDQIQELIKCRDDVIYFCENYVKVQHPKRGAIPFEPYEYQKRMLKAFQENQFTAVLAGRQLGKCVTGDTIIKCAIVDVDNMSTLKRMMLWMVDRSLYRKLFCR